MKKSNINKAVFLDRDGVVIRLLVEKGPKEIARNPSEVELLAHAAEGIKYIKDKGWLAVIISNQPDVAKGKATLLDIQSTMKETERILQSKGALIDSIYYCLHHPDSGQVVNRQYLADCDCRKPKPGLLLRAAKDLDIDLRNSWMVGDSLTDIQAGRAAGCNTVLIGEHLEKEFLNQIVAPDVVAKNLLEAVKIIVIK